VIIIRLWVGAEVVARLPLRTAADAATRPVSAITGLLLYKPPRR